MTEQETFKIIRFIADNYQAKFKIDDVKALVKSWHRTLAGWDYEMLLTRLDRHISLSPFPPALSDLLRPQSEETSAVPNAEQTQIMIDSLYTVSNPTSAEEVSMHLAEIRKRIMGGADANGKPGSGKTLDEPAS